MQTIAVIPARYASTRFPGKPLAKETGKYLIQHVVEQVQLAPLINACVVATDDPRIAEAVHSFGAQAVMTSADHRSGTDRIAEVARKMNFDVFVNIQGDEPEIEPVSISQMVELLRDHNECVMATMACPFRFVERGDPQDPNAVKVQINTQHFATDFSRKLLLAPAGCEFDDDPHPMLHLGMYAYRRDFLLEFTEWGVSPRECAEHLEQLRAIEHGCSIAVGLVRRAAVGIDTPEDYAAFVHRYSVGAQGRVPT